MYCGVLFCHSLLNISLSSGNGYCPVESEDWEIVGKVVGIIALIAGVLTILVIYPFCIDRSYERKIFKPERDARKEAEEAKKKGHQSQDTYTEEHDESFEVFELPENERERKMRDATKLRNLNKKKRYGFERDKKETKQKEKNSEKMTKFLKQAEIDQGFQKIKNLVEDKKTQNLISNVRQGAQNVATKFEKGFNRKSARFERGVAQASARYTKRNDVRYDKMNESNVSVAFSKAESPPKGQLISE